MADLVADLVFDLSQTGSSYLDMSRSLKPGRRPVQAIFHYAILLAIAGLETSSRPGRKQDSVMEFGLGSTYIRERDMAKRCAAREPFYTVMWANRYAEN